MIIEEGAHRAPDVPQSTIDLVFTNHLGTVEWRHQTFGTDYSLLSVDKNLSFQLKYVKPSSGISFTLTPSTGPGWQMTGRVDSNIIASLGFQIERQRVGGKHPIVTDQDLAEIALLGGLYKKSIQEIRVSLTLPGSNVKKLLKALWSPTTNRFELPNYIRDFKLNGEKSLLLPQKGNSHSALVVVPRG